MDSKYYDMLWRRTFDYFWDDPDRYPIAKSVCTKSEYFSLITPNDCREFIEFMISHDAIEREFSKNKPDLYFCFDAKTVPELDIQLTLRGY